MRTWPVPNQPPQRPHSAMSRQRLRLIATASVLLSLLILAGHRQPSRRSDPAASRRRDRILCWIVTMPRNVAKAEAVKRTWGRKCDRLIFVSSQNETSLPAVGLPIGGESRGKLWEKAKLTLRHVYGNYLDDYDWFFKADDDTYAVMENLRHLLAEFDRSQPLFIGNMFMAHGFQRIKCLAGGAGYVFSREALRRVVEIGLDQNACPTKFNGVEDDLTITQCMLNVNVTVPSSTKDAAGKHRFLSGSLEQFYSGHFGTTTCEPETKVSGTNEMEPKAADRQVRNCVSDEPVSFHYVSGAAMYAYEHLLYKVKIHADRVDST